MTATPAAFENLNLGETSDDAVSTDHDADDTQRRDSQIIKEPSYPHAETVHLSVTGEALGMAEHQS